MSLNHPLAHTYVLAGDPRECTNKVSERIEELFVNRPEEVQIDAAVVETLTISMARELSQRGRQLAQGEARCSIRGFQLATRPAQNALLKTLEEPAEGVHFFLITPTPNHLLETVRSRANQSDFCANSNAQLEDAAQSFLAADGLPARLEIAHNIAQDGQLVGFVASLGSILTTESITLQQALETVTTWLQESGRSDKQIAEFLAIAASQTDDSN
jgi:hypothetical protein